MPSGNRSVRDPICHITKNYVFQKLENRRK